MANYQVVTQGLSEGITKAVAAQRLRQLNLDDTVIAKLVSCSVVLRKGLNLEQAKVFEDKLSRAGLKVAIVSEDKGKKFSATFSQLASKATNMMQMRKLEDKLGKKFKDLSSLLSSGKDGEGDNKLFDKNSAHKARKMREFDLSQKCAQPVNTSGPWRSQQDVEQLFRGEMPKLKFSVTLPINSVEGAVLSVLLPGIYVLIVLCIGLIFLGNNWDFMLGKGASSVFGFIALFGFLNLFYIALLGFLTKPLIMTQPTSPAVKISRHECPGLHWLVETICRKLKIDSPEKISLDMSLDMRLTYLDHLKGFLDNRTHLIIGAPLTQSLSTSEFVGVLSQTLAHQRQPFSGRAYFIVRAVNQWLKTAAEESDAWDKWIKNQRNQAEILVIVDLLLKSAERVIATNKAIFSFMLRQNKRLVGQAARALEFHADEYAAIIIGSDLFEQLGYEYRKAIRAFDEAIDINDQLMNKNQLLQDLPEVVGTLTRNYDKKIESLIHQEIERQIRYPWEPHPPDWERIDKVNFLQVSAIFFSDEVLVRAIPGLSALGVRATQAYYHHQGLDLADFQVVRPKL